MNVTRDVVNDLLPLYMSGEASDDTRTLVDEYLRAHPDFADQVRSSAERTVALLRGVSTGPRSDLETITLERARRFGRVQATVLGFAIGLSLTPLSVGFRGGRLVWIMLRDSPITAAYFWIGAAVLWAVYFAMDRRMKASP